MDTLVRGGPPREVIAELIAFYNDSATTRTVGDVTLPAGSRFEGRLASIAAPCASRAACGGRSRWRMGPCICCRCGVEGDILVVGGRLIRAAEARTPGGSGCSGMPPRSAGARRQPRAPGATPTARRAGHREDFVSDGEGENHPAPRHRRHLQPDRRAADRIRPALRAAPAQRSARARSPWDPADGRRRQPSQQRFRLSGACGVPVRRPSESRGRLYSDVDADRRSAAVAQRVRLGGVPAAARLSGLFRAAGRRRMAVGSSRPGRSGSSSRSAETTRPRCRPSTPGRCSATATSGDATR